VSPPEPADAQPRSAVAPRQVVVLSGKGGTGKTSVVAAIATLTPSKVLADCDVDAADLHLVLDPQRRHTETFLAGKEARIAPERCSACGVCAEHCRFDAIRVTSHNGGRSVYAVDPIACEGCGLCARVCTPGAVDMVDAERGEWFIADTRHGPLVYARLNIGGENSGKLVTVVRDQALALAEEMGASLVVVDGPPGIGCPVIASVTGADLVLAVTEPSVSGVHDLERAAELVGGFGLPLTVCINKSDLNRDMAQHIREVCAARDWPVVGELDYDVAVVRAQVEGKSIVEYGGSVVADQIRKMWDVLEDTLKKVEA
jgi:MinD superfamily P-loop ATPase